MKAIGITTHGGPEVLQFMEVPWPEPRPGDVLVKVHAFAVNPVDTKRRSAGQPGSSVLNPPMILGWDAAGVVEMVGSQAAKFQVGDEVYFAGDSSRPGCYAEYIAVDERLVARKPITLNYSEAAALPLTALTAWEAFFENMCLPFESSQPPATVLIVGGAGGVGSIAIQIAKQVAGSFVIATASRPESREFCQRMGADAVIDHSMDLDPQIRSLGKKGMDYILNTAAKSNFRQLEQVLNPLGRLCTITGAGEVLKAMDAELLVQKRLTLTFELMFTRPKLGVSPEKQGQILARVTDLVDRKVLVSTLTTILDWTEIQRAHQMLETGKTIGKIVLQVIH